MLIKEKLKQVVLQMEMLKDVVEASGSQMDYNENNEYINSWRFEESSAGIQDEINNLNALIDDMD